MTYEILKKSDVNEIVQIAKEVFVHDIIDADIFIEKSFEDPYYDPELCWVAKENNEIVGFIVGGYRDYEKGKFGYIKLIGVAPEFQRKKVASNLLQKVEEKVKAMGATELKMMDIPLNYFMPGLDPRYTECFVFLLKNGFNKVGENHNMNVDFTDNDFSTAAQEKVLTKEGFEIKRADKGDFEGVMEFVRPIWKLWEYEIEQSYKNNPITLHIAKLQGKVVAFSMHSGNNKGLPWFGPMGTDPSLRGKKMGEILLKRCLADQKAVGFNYSIIPWVGPTPFYLKTVNAKVSRVFWTLSKPLVNKEGK